LLGVNEGPHLIDLYALGRQIEDMFIMIGLANLADVRKSLATVFLLTPVARQMALYRYSLAKLVKIFALGSGNLFQGPDVKHNLN
jgi:hypothetical protein